MSLSSSCLFVGAQLCWAIAGRPWAHEESPNKFSSHEVRPHNITDKKKPAEAGFFVERFRPQPREGIKVPARANTELGAVIFKVLLGLANTPRLTAG